MANPYVAAANGPGGQMYQAALAGNASQQSSSDFFLANYRMGKTLGIGSFGKARPAAGLGAAAAACGAVPGRAGV
jgi:hypothetical protein